MNTRLPDPLDVIFASFFSFDCQFPFPYCLFSCALLCEEISRFGAAISPLWRAIKSKCCLLSLPSSILKQAMNPIQQRLLALANTPADQLSTLGGFGGGPRSNPYNLHSAQHQEQLAAAAAPPPHHHSVPRLDDGEPPQVRHSPFQILPTMHFIF